MLMICGVLHVNRLCDRTAYEDTTELDAGTLHSPAVIHTGYRLDCVRV